MLRFWVLSVLVCAGLRAGETSYPLESIAVEGSTVPKDVVLELAGLRIGEPANKEVIERGCKQLEDTGVFESIKYKYGPGPRNGVALTVSLIDQTKLLPAALDVPGIDEAETWKWLESRFPTFERKVPGADTAQQYLAGALAKHWEAQLHGQKVVARIETDLVVRRTIISFQPEVLPRVAEMTFIGEHEFTSEQLSGLMRKVVAGDGYMARTFRSYLELNVRPAYETHGMYRVQFPGISMRAMDGGSVAVATTIEEGQKYTLGAVQLIGDGLPTDRMLAAAGFQNGRLANWTEIARGIESSETVLRRTGYRVAAASPARVYDDALHVLNLNIAYRKGPLFHFGKVTFAGLTPELEAKARAAWQMQPGDPYDYNYPSDFLRAFSKTMDLRQFRKFQPKEQAGAGEHVTDIVMTFEPKQ